MIVCACAHPSIDKLFEVERLTPGAIHRPSAFAQVAGGKGLNVARAAVALGADVRAVALVGGHAGAWIEDALAESGIDATFARGAHETRSCLSVADDATADLTEFYENGPAVDRAVWEEFVAAVAASLDGASWLSISGSLPPGIAEDGYGAIVDAAKRSGARVAADERGPFLERILRFEPDLVKVNASEAAEVLGRDVRDVDSAFGATEELRARAGGHAREVVVTLGANGAVAVCGDGRRLRGTLDVRGRYPVGSGDAFLAGLLGALDAGGTFEDALANALGAAAANAEVRGAGCLNAERARALGARARVVRI